MSRGALVSFLTMLDRIRHWFSDTPEGVPLNLGMGMLGLVLGLVQERPQLVLLGLCYAGAFLLVGFRARWARYALMVLFLFNKHLPLL